MKQTQRLKQIVCKKDYEPGNRAAMMLLLRRTLVQQQTMRQCESKIRSDGSKLSDR